MTGEIIVVTGKTIVMTVVAMVITRMMTMMTMRRKKENKVNWNISKMNLGMIINPYCG